MPRMEPFWQGSCSQPELIGRLRGCSSLTSRYQLSNDHAHHYLLRALVSCGRCRLACVGRSSRGGYAYYVCHGRHLTLATLREEKCSARSIPVEQLDELVWQDLCGLLTQPEHIADALARAQGGHWLPQALHARRENLRKARVSVEQQMERLTDAYLANVLELEEYKRRRQELEQRFQGKYAIWRQMFSATMRCQPWSNPSKRSASASCKV